MKIYVNDNQIRKTHWACRNDTEWYYEIVDNILIIRTEAHDTIHITQEIGRKLVDIISKELL